MNTGNLRGLILLSAAALLTAGYLMARKAGTAESAQAAASSSAASAKAPVVFRIGPATLASREVAVYRMHEGEQATFRILLPQDGHLALHGYLDDIPVTANQEVVIPLTASHAGRFPMHVHGQDGSHAEIGMLEVLPRP